MPKLECMNVCVFLGLDEDDMTMVTREFSDVDSFVVNEQNYLVIRRMGLDVEWFPPGTYVRFQLTYKFDNGLEVNPDGLKGAPQDVGMGVTVSASGGRTA